jgi:hypothetical protein
MKRLAGLLQEYALRWYRKINTLLIRFFYYNPVILLNVNLTSLHLQTEMSRFITCFQYTNISVYKHAV